jgi:hypothetical protein
VGLFEATFMELERQQRDASIAMLWTATEICTDVLLLSSMGVLDT